MTAYVVFVALIACVFVLIRHGLEKAFLWVWIPFFLALPFSFWVNIPGLPDPNFMQAAMLPLLFVVVRNRMLRARFGRMEVLLVAYIGLRVFADYTSRGYSDAQNYGFYLLTCVAGPYLLGRYVIDSRRMDIETSRMFVLMFLVFFLFFLFEAKFWVSPSFKLLSPLFPDAFSGLSMRYGIARTAGTFEHPILACIMVVAVYRMHRWLAWSGSWDGQQEGVWARVQKAATRCHLSLSTAITIVLVLMAAMTMSRGPWIGAVAGAALAICGNFKRRGRGLAIMCAVLVFGALVGSAALDAYITPREGEILSGEAQTMLYRKVMVERYAEFLMERQWLGWGLTGVPKIAGMESLDNAFFLMALQHGVFAPALFVLIFMYAIASQLKFGLKSPPGKAPLGFTFSAVYVMCFISFATVYMGAQTEPMLFLLLGWGEGLKYRRAESLDASEVPAARLTFRRVMV